MDSAEDYIARIHGSLNEHLNEDPTGLCVLFATQVAKRLVAEGKPFYFVRLQDLVWESEFDFYTRPIKPRLYSGRVSMGGHTVCCESDLAYDPLMGKPIPLKDYCIEVFGEEIPQSVLSEEEKRDSIRWGKSLSAPDSLKFSRFSFDVV